MARPLKKIDPEQVRQLAMIDCSNAEMAAVLGCSPDTLERRFAAVIKEGRDQGCSSLKKKQFQMAMAGDKTMLVWLGKVRLKQKDFSRVELTGADGAPIKSQVELSATESLIKAIKATAGDDLENGFE